jgi:N,N'-diacetyllegionaminate synthase
MSTNLEISKTLKFLQKNKTFEISLLHCISSYPTKITDINLKSISLLKEKFKKETGLSDHTISTKIPSYAVIAGASIIEKHFTLDKNMSGPDHKSSLNPKQFKQMVNHIRKAEIIYGYYCKERLQQENEIKNL